MSTEEQVNILEDISRRSINPLELGEQDKKRNIDVTYAKQEIEKSDSWLKSNENKSPADRLSGWMSETKDFMFTPDTVDYYHGVKESLLSAATPGIDGRQTNIDDIKDQLTSFDTQEESTAFYRDNADKWPSYVHESLGDYFPKLFDIQAQRDLERSRITQSMSIKNSLNNLELNLDPDVSVEAHVRDALKAFSYDQVDAITTPSGRISIPLNGSEANAYALDDAPSSATEKFIEYADLIPAITPIIKNSLDKAREDTLKSEKTARVSLFNKIPSNAIPKKFITNIIIDGASSPEGGLKQINSLIQNKMEKGFYQKSGEASAELFNMYHDVTKTLARRLNGGKVL